MKFSYLIAILPFFLQHVLGEEFTGYMCGILYTPDITSKSCNDAEREAVYNYVNDAIKCAIDGKNVALSETGDCDFAELGITPNRRRRLQLACDACCDMPTVCWMIRGYCPCARRLEEQSFGEVVDAEPQMKHHVRFLVSQDTPESPTVCMLAGVSQSYVLVFR